MSARIPRVGLEVHVRLKTASKLFCACPNTSGGRPNANTCPVCVGLPGAMPALNLHAVELALRAALLLDCKIHPMFAFDRKHYAYPDLPKGYQTTQSRHPLATGGALVLESGRRIKLVGIHMEDDAGRNRHVPGATLVDLSRAGAPLIEIVTEPVLHHGAEVRDFLYRLREELRFAGVSDCDMEKGNLRSDVNVSLVGRDRPGFARVELKNLNSIRAAGEAVTAEFARQEKLLAALNAGRGPGPTDETRGWHAEGRRSFPMRAKEHATEYRFLPEPDLPAVRVEAKDIEVVRGELPEGPAAIRARWKDAGIGLKLAHALTQRPARAAYFDAAVAAGARPNLAAKWITNELAARGPQSERKLLPRALAELLILLDQGQLSRAGAERVMDLQIETACNTPAKEQALELGLLARPTEAASNRSGDLLERLVHKAIADCPVAATDFTKGNPKALDALVGTAMRAAQGRLDGSEVRQALLRALT